MEPLVSVCVITYNSQKTIIETLDSVKRQTYSNLELVISDDGSKDSTVSLVNEWLKNNSSSFVAAKLVVAKVNSGTAMNLNQAVTNSHGSWIKILAGDDLLQDNSITQFVNQAAAYQNIDFFVSQVKVFSDGNANLSGIQSGYDYLHHLQHSSYSKKRRISAHRLIYPGPAWFFSRKLYESIGGFDKRYPFLDENPFSFNALKSGYNIQPVDERLVLYRVSSNSVSHTVNVRTRKLLYEQDYDFYKKNQLPELKKKFMYFHILDQEIFYFLSRWSILKMEKTGHAHSFISKLRFISPVYLIFKIKYKIWVKFNGIY